MDEYNLKDEIGRYVAHLTVEIRSARRWRSVARELSEHMEDAVYAHMLEGETEEKAFRGACDEMGDTSAVSALLAAVHNKDKLPSWVKWLAFSGIAALLVAVYTFVENDIVRAWLLFFVQATLLVCGVWVFYSLWQIVRAFRKRLDAVRRLNRYAKENGLPLARLENPYRALFTKGNVPSFMIETSEKRFLPTFFPTILRKKHLRFLEGGLYTYISHVGYMMLYTHRFGLIGVGAQVAIQKNTKLFPYTHSQLIEVPKGVHLMPQIEWERAKSAEKETINVLLLNPIPFRASGVKNGHATELRDGDRLDAMTVYSMTGFLLYLEGERIRRGTHRM